MPLTTLRKRKADAYGIGPLPPVPTPVYWAYRVANGILDPGAYRYGLDADGQVMEDYTLSTAAPSTFGVLEPILDDSSALVSPGSLAWSSGDTIEVWDPDTDDRYSWTAPGGSETRYLGGPYYHSGYLWCLVAWRDDADDQVLQVRLYRFATDLTSPTLMDSTSYDAGAFVDPDTSADLIALCSGSLLVWYELHSWEVLPVRAALPAGTITLGAPKDYTGESSEVPPYGILRPVSGGASGIGSVPQAAFGEHWIKIADSTGADPTSHEEVTLSTDGGGGSIYDVRSWNADDGSEAIYPSGDDVAFVSPGDGTELSRLESSVYVHLVARIP